jgi:hypothetical protein
VEQLAEDDFETLTHLSFSLHHDTKQKFFDLATWLFENGADDQVVNKDGLSPYDGLGGGDDDDEG